MNDLCQDASCHYYYLYFIKESLGQLYIYTRLYHGKHYASRLIIEQKTQSCNKKIKKKRSKVGTRL